MTSERWAEIIEIVREESTYQGFEISTKEMDIIEREVLKPVRKAMERIGFDPEEEWDLEELSENLEPADMVRVIYAVGNALR